MTGLYLIAAGTALLWIVSCLIAGALGNFRGAWALGLLGPVGWIIARAMRARPETRKHRRSRPR